MNDSRDHEQDQKSGEAARSLPPSRQALMLSHVERPVVPGDALDLFSVSDRTAKLDFRFSVAGVQHLFHALQIPPVVVLSDGYRFGGLEALCVMLRRLAYPARLPT